jgi:hypothetical protein
VNIRKLIRIAVFGAAVTVGLVIWLPVPQTQVIGSLPQGDLKVIRGLVQHELRWLLPQRSWDTLLYPRYVVESLWEYHQKRILWVQVLEDGKVKVFVAVSKKAILCDGHEFILERNPQWHVTGGGQWQVPKGVPEDLRIPPDA